MTQRGAHRCHADSCRKLSTRQWQRTATDQETRAESQRLTANRQRIIDHQRTEATLAVVEIRARLETITERAETDRQAADVLPAMQARLTAAEAALEAIIDVDPVTVSDITIAVHACDDHAVDLDAAAQLHAPGCLTEHGDCRCELDTAGV